MPPAASPNAAPSNAPSRTGSDALPHIAIILGSTRPNRNGEAVAKWVHEVAGRRDDARFTLVDVAEQGLPLLDEPVPPSMGKYSKDHTKRWSAKIAQYDGFVVVTAEYNHGVPGALKNAIDFLYKEWNNKAAGFVGYGSAGGVRAVEHLRDIMAELQVATVRAQVMFSLRDDFKDYSEFKPRSHHEGDVKAMLDQLVAWSRALRSVRSPAPTNAGAGAGEAAKERTEKPTEKPTAGQAEHARPPRPHPGGREHAEPTTSGARDPEVRPGRADIKTP